MDRIELIELARQASGQGELRLAAGETLFREGDEGDRMFVIASGKLRLTINNEHLDIESTGGIVGEMALIEHTQRTATVTAEQDSILIPLGTHEFTALVARQPGFAIHIMKIQSERLRKANEVLNLF